MELGPLDVQPTGTFHLGKLVELEDIGAAAGPVGIVPLFAIFTPA